MSAVAPALRVTQARIVLSEWTKLRSLRSTRWSLLVATLLTIGIPLLASSVISSHWGSQSPQERADFNPLDVALIGSLVGQLAIGVLGVLVITGEYSTGMIRATMTAVPKRLPVLWAKRSEERRVGKEWRSWGSASQSTATWSRMMAAMRC